MNPKVIAGIEADLSEGQSWDDMIPVTMSREQWTMAIIVLMQAAHEMQGGVDAAIEAARNGELTATLMVPHLMESHRLMASICQAATKTVYPEIAEKAEAELEQRKAEARAKADA